MLSFLAFVSDWVCFATAANPGAFQSATGRDPAEIIDLFLVCNVMSCFLFTDVAKAFGLRRVMVAASIVMTLGCCLRSGFDAGTLPPYETIKLGTAGRGAGALVRVWARPAEGAIPRGRLPSRSLLSRDASSARVEGRAQAMVGFSQPFFQCSPPLLSATWFGKRERATATATALNANQLGIAAVRAGVGIPRRAPRGGRRRSLERARRRSSSAV